MANRKWSVGNGLGTVFSGSLLTTGGVAAGIPGAASAASQLQALTEAPEPAPEDHQVIIYNVFFWTTLSIERFYRSHPV